MSPRFCPIALATFLGTFLALMLAAFLPARGIAQTVAPLTKFEQVGGRCVRAVSPENQPSPAIVGARHGVPLRPATRMTFISPGGPKAHGNSVESHVIPAKLVLRESGGAGIRFLLDMDPRLRGGDVLTFICMGGPLAHDHSLGPGR
jgi:hypothetical protein